MSPKTEGRLDRYHIGIPRENPKSALDLGLSEGSLTCDPYHTLLGERITFTM